MFGGMYQKVFTSLLLLSKAGVCKMYEQVSQGVLIWMRLLQLGLSIVQGQNHRPYRQCEQHRDVTGSIERKSMQTQGPS